ncbi:MAG TPA: hypothetical protein PK504_08115 [Ferruginibacter sp.]|nr:hypothetical protein [Ferruginibacter sp.]HRE63839.1 hypothetical protein [Ferruginibacter sp.]
MKNILVLILSIVFFNFWAAAQSKDSVFTLIGNELCNDIKAKHSELTQAEDMEMELGLLMIPYFSKYESEIKKIIDGFDMTDPNHLQTLGVEIGKKLIACPEFMILVNSNRDIIKNARAEVTISLIGTLQAVSVGEFTSFSIKTTSGKQEKIWWMEYFPGDSKIADGSLINKQVTVQYIEKEIYNARLKDYVKIKIAKSVN